MKTAKKSQKGKKLISGLAIIALLGIAFFRNSPLQLWISACATLLWICIIFGADIARAFHRTIAHLHVHLQIWLQNNAEKKNAAIATKNEAISISEGTEPDISSAYEMLQSEYAQMEEFCKLNLSWRISSWMKGIYPDAAFAWQEDDNHLVQRILNHETIRIETMDTGEYHCAELSVDEIGGGIKMQFLKIVDAEKIKRDNTATNETGQKGVVKNWYTSIGQKALANIVGNVRPLGVSKLHLMGNGDVHCGSNKKKSQWSIAQFPKKDNWGELVRVLNEDGLQATAYGDYVEIAWN